MSTITQCSDRHPWTGEPGWIVIAITADKDAELEAVTQEHIVQGFQVWIDGFSPDSRRTVVVFRQKQDTVKENV